MIYETDSRKVKEGQIFVAIKGHTVDGHDYIDDAIKNGASKIICEKEINVETPFKVVNSTEEYLKEKLKDKYASKINKLKIIGVTGTNGKTTTCYLTYQLLKLMDVKVAYMGTIGFYYKDKIITLENTTPDILTIYKLLLEAVENDCTTLVMEVSSHALSYQRIYGLHIDIACFTNLTEDHLDYHKTMTNYLKEKLKIISYLPKNGTLIVNADDEASNKFTEKFNNFISLGTNGKFKIIKSNISPNKTEIFFNYNKNNYIVTTNLTSKFNVYNYMTSLVILFALGYSINDIITITSKIIPPKGRCETYEVNDGYAVVDYAHTPDAVEKVITAYAELAQNRIITIIGCGGDRDPMKRPMMGKIATELSDYVILTNDNPRTEDPKKIMKDILKGIKKENYEIELDRTVAIKKGINMMQKNDILLVLGKGHEDYQILGRTKIHLDDAEEIKLWKKKEDK